MASFLTFELCLKSLATIQLHANDLVSRIAYNFVLIAHIANICMYGQAPRTLSPSGVHPSSMQRMFNNNAGDFATISPIMPAAVSTCVWCVYHYVLVEWSNLMGEDTSKKTNNKTFKHTNVHANVKCVHICYDRS